MNAKAFFSDRPIAYHPILAKVCGSVTAALFLSQIAYWSDKGTSADGWIWKTQEEMHDETGLTRSEQETARRILRDLKVLQEDRRGVPARMWYFIDWDVLTNLIDTYEQSRLQDSRKLDGAKAAIKDAGKPQSIQRVSETTTENTTEKNNNAAFEKIASDQTMGVCWQEVVSLLITFSPAAQSAFVDIWDKFPDKRRHDFAVKQTRLYANPVSWKYYESCYLRYDPDKVKPPPMPRYQRQAPVSNLRTRTD